MKTKYWVWKNPACNGISPDWQELTGEEFLALVRSPEGKNRSFIKLETGSEDFSGGRIVMEATKSEYVKWRKEKDRSDYIREQQQKSGYQVISYHAMEIGDGFSGEEILADAGTSIEMDYIKSAELEQLKDALAQLTEDEHRLIDYFFLSGSKGSVRGYSATTGIPIMTVQYRKTAALKKLKNFFEGGFVQNKN